MRSISVGQLVIIIFLVALLVLTGYFVMSTWSQSSDVPMNKHGWIALGLGTFFSLVIGCGLMALMFYSSRSGHDEKADPFRRRQPPEN